MRLLPRLVSLGGHRPRRVNLRLIARLWAACKQAAGDKSFEDIEKELLNGQKLQGTLTVREVYRIL